MEYLGLYYEFYKIKLKGIAQYRGAFLMTTFSKAVNYLSRFVVIWIMINQFRTMGTWSAYEVLILYGLNSASYALAGSCFYHITTYLSQLVRDGTMDEVLTKPLNPFVYLMSRFFSTGYVGTFSISIFIILFSLIKLQIPFTLSRILFLIVSILSGGIITAAVMICCSVPAFWMVRNSAIKNLVFDMKHFVEYPITIFNKSIQFILTFVLPFAFITFFPALVILDKQDYAFFPEWLPYLTPVVAVVLFAAAYKFWFYGLKRYDSAGS